MGHTAISESRRLWAGRRLGILAGSLGVHVAVLALIGLGLVQGRPVSNDATVPIEIEFEPRPLMAGGLARRTASAQNGPAAILSSPYRSDPLVAHRPTPPLPRSAAMPPHPAETAAQSGGVSVADAWRVKTPNPNDPTAPGLRPGGLNCRVMNGLLSFSEQRICDESLGAAPGATRHIGPRALDASEARRQAQFARESTAAMARYERLRAPMRAGVGVVGAAPECPGGNLRGTCPGANLRREFQHAEESPFGGVAGPK